MSVKELLSVDMKRSFHSLSTMHSFAASAENRKIVEGISRLGNLCKGVESWAVGQAPESDCQNPVVPPLPQSGKWQSGDCHRNHGKKIRLSLQSRRSQQSLLLPSSLLEV